MGFEVTNVDEIWWAVTKEYTIDYEGEEIRFRAADDSNGCDFFIYEPDGWSFEKTEEVMETLKEAWLEGELD